MILSHHIGPAEICFPHSTRVLTAVSVLDWTLQLLMILKVPIILLHIMKFTYNEDLKKI